MRVLGQLLLGIVLVIVAAKLADAQQPTTALTPTREETILTPLPPPAAPQQESLADMARKVRTNKKAEILVNEEDAQKLFKEIDDILAFASEHSQLPKRASVKHKLVGEAETNRHIVADLAEEAKRIKTDELVLKKFGLLPMRFNLDGYLKDAPAKELAGFYDPRDKTMYLLNWIDYREQRAVMAHELTHALQDQNYGLTAWENAGAVRKGRNGVPIDNGVEEEARRAAVEGQAMLVFFDWLVRASGRRLSTATQNIDALKNDLMSDYESPVSFRDTPIMFKELSMFPYFDGFGFELEILKHSGTPAAFAGVFARPPRDTHEIMQPSAYLSGVRTPAFRLPDLTQAVGTEYARVDSGAIGELDTRIMCKEFGRENDEFSVAPQWNGGAFVAFKKPSASVRKDSELLPADIALLYVSRWKTYKAARRFADIYRDSLLKRHQLDYNTGKPDECEEGATCAVKWSAHFQTAEGPVFMEIAKDNSLIICLGLEEQKVGQVKQALSGRPKSATTAAFAEPELSLRFANSPAVQAMRADVFDYLTSKLAQQ